MQFIEGGIEGQNSIDESLLWADGVSVVTDRALADTK